MLATYHTKEMATHSVVWDELHFSDTQEVMNAAHCTTTENINFFFHLTVEIKYLNKGGDVLLGCLYHNRVFLCCIINAKR